MSVLNKLNRYATPMINSGRYMYDAEVVESLVASIENAQRLRLADIKALQDKLNQQSTKLAEALKLKNDVLERTSGIDYRLKLLEKMFEELPLQEIGELLGVSAGTRIPVAILPELKKLKKRLEETEEARRQATTQWQHFDKVCDNLQKINAKLEEELKGLRPSEPKFRVGQVIMHGQYAYKIQRVQTLSNGSHIYYYTEYSHFAEKELRALTDEER